MWRLGVVVIFLVLSPALVTAEEPGIADRYFLSGDGEVSLQNPKTGAAARVQYRLAGGYPQEARRQIDWLFGVPEGSEDHISLRLVSALDYVEDRFHIPIVILSGYRSAEYNDNLRAQGGGAARASLHIEGMAADVVVKKKLARQIWGVVKDLRCCGIGFYGGDSLHIDTGPARFWTQATSKVRTDISEHNKQIMVRSRQDIYLPGEQVELKLARVTAYPVGLASGFFIVRDGQTLQDFAFDGKAGACLPVTGPKDRTVTWTIPAGFRPEGKVQVRLRFCDKPSPEMPDQIDSNLILIRQRS